MKKILMFFLVLTLIMGTVNVFAQDDDFFIIEDENDAFLEFEDDEEMIFDDEEGESDSSEDLLTDWDSMDLTVYDYDHITVGNPTPLNGEFFTDLWGNDTADTDVRHLVTGYNLIIWDTEESIFRFDRSVVSGAVVTEDQYGNRTYLISLCSDLYYSDGHRITANDYAFSVLLQSSPMIAELGGHPAVYDYLMGYEDYASGAQPYISGVRVLSDTLISFTVKGESLPYFYELSRLAFYPYPIHKIAPGCTVYNSPEGAYIANMYDNTNTQYFSVSMLRTSILDPVYGYLVKPDPASGPYRLISYDGTSANFEVNSFYKGNEEGKKPRIKRITYTQADNETMIDDLKAGTFALLNKVTFSQNIIKGLQLCMENPQYTRSNYPRIGLTYIFFNPESALVQEQKVRQAIDYCLDTPEFIRNYVGQFGLEVDGLYGMGQWMTNAVTGALAFPMDLPEDATPEEEAEYQQKMEQWDELSLDGITIYDLDTDAAVSLLTDAGWTLNAAGAGYDAETDEYRCKMFGDELRCLDLTMGYNEATNAADSFDENFIQFLSEAGIRLTLVPLAFDDIVEAHNEHTFSGLDMIYFGDNFNVSFDPELFFWSADAGDTTADSLLAVYTELSRLADDMDRTEPAELLEYVLKWLTFQERLSQLLPIIPVYSNVYFDFYTRELDSYIIEEHISWGKAIVPARMRSLKAIEMDSLVDMEVELSYATGEGDLDISTMFTREAKQSQDYSEGALSLFPQEVRDEIPAEYRTINEFISTRLNIEITDQTDFVALHYNFQTPYEADETVYVLFGLPGRGSDVDWFAAEGRSLGKGTVRVVLEKERLELLNGKTFAVAVVSK